MTEATPRAAYERIAAPTLILCGAPKQPARLMQQAEFHEHVGAENICPNIETALRRAAAVHARAA